MACAGKCLQSCLPLREMLCGKPCGALSKEDPLIEHSACMFAWDIVVVVTFRPVRTFQDRSSNSRERLVFDLLRERWLLMAIEGERYNKTLLSPCRIGFAGCSINDASSREFAARLCTMTNGTLIQSSSIGTVR